MPSDFWNIRGRQAFTTFSTRPAGLYLRRSLALAIGDEALGLANKLLELCLLRSRNQTLVNDAVIKVLQE